MKKIMFALVALAMAVVAQASSVKWGIMTGQALADIQSGTAYLVIGSLPNASAFEGKQSFSVADLTGEVYRQGTVSGGSYLSSAESITSPVSTLTVYMAVISDDGKSIAVSTTTKSLKIAAAATPANVQWASSGFTTYTAGGGGDVPEPTSGLLLLVGGAMLALRRKQKK